MANLSFSITTTAGTVTQDGPTISDANMDRFIDYLWDNYPQIDNTDPENPVPKPRNAANEAQAFRDWATAMWNGTKANVLRYEKVAAAKAAEEAVQDIEA